VSQAQKVLQGKAMKSVGKLIAILSIATALGGVALAADAQRLQAFVTWVSAGDSFNQGVVSALRGNYKEAIENYDQAIQIKPDWARAYYKRGQARLGTKDYKEAIEDFNQALRIEPNFAKSYSGRCIVRFHQGDYQGAIEDCTQALKINFRLTEALYYRGLARFKLNNHQDGVKDCQKALRLSPSQTFLDDAQAYYFRAFVRSQLKDYQGAIKDYDQVIRIEPTFTQAYYERGQAHANTEDYEAAIKDYNWVLCDREFSCIGTLLALNKQTKALVIDKALENYPAWKAGARKDDQILEIEGQSTVNMTVGEASKRIRGLAGTPVTLRIARKGKGKFELKPIRALIISPKNAQVYSSRAYAQYKRGDKQRGDKQEAIKDWQTAVKLYSDQGDAASARRIQEFLKTLQ
jgi:tetratricopeptide (TPR) repeat protein